MTAEDTQFWEDVLRRSSKDSEQPLRSEGSVLVLGEAGAGKRRLVQALAKQISSTGGGEIPQELTKFPEYLSYSYMDAGDDGGRVNIWRMCRKTFEDSYDLILDPTRDENLVIVVAIDLSKSDCATTLYEWLTLVNSKINDFIARQKESSKVSSIADNSGREEFKVNISTDANSSNICRRPPVVVVGCKADTLEAKEVESMARSKAKQGGLRAVCLDGGASGLIFTSAVFSENKESNSNCSALLQHLTLLLNTKSGTKDKLISDGIIQDGTIDVIVPDMRADSTDLIHAATDVDADLVLKNIRASIEQSKHKIKDLGSSRSATSSSAALLEEESQWLKQFLSAEKNNALEINTSIISTESVSAISTPGSTRRKNTLTSNPLASVGSKSSTSSSATLSSLQKQSAASVGTSSKEGTTKVVKKKVGTKKDNPRGFFEDLLTK